MNVRVSSVFVLFCLGCGFEAGLSPIHRFLPTVYKIHSSTLIRMGNRQEGLMRKVEEEESIFM
jgi:hypothetical protein